ncbi:39S mitochondrial ribosomal protein L46-domain-containing protein [Melanogaster broomeanus]|nr:39S mitochondrial ribosomal protein L46-domain-containing protein [Melanogaster broomeanus]
MFSRSGAVVVQTISKSRSFTTEVQPTESAGSSSSTTPLTHPKKISPPNLHTAIILNRSPLITRTPTPFEKAFFAYQARIHRALHNPFPTEFYFKQGSLLETRFNIEERRRERRNFGAPFGIDKSEEPSEATTLMETAMRDEVDESMPRVHEADTKNDLQSLNRKGQRNLYLLLKTQENGKDVWRFPQGSVEKGEFLHVAAHRRLDAECGRNMDTWIVSRNPIGAYHPPKPIASLRGRQRVFFYKAHILAGQVCPDSKRYQDFAWLTKGEIGQRTEENYWLGIKDMLTDF